MPANCCYDTRSIPIKGEVRVRRPRSAQKKLNSALSQQLVSDVNALRRNGERRHAVKVLSLRSQGFATGRQHAYCWISTQ
jgi:hypothetical protein